MPTESSHIVLYRSIMSCLGLAGLLMTGCGSSRGIDEIRTELRSDLAAGRLTEARTDINALHDSHFAGEHDDWEAAADASIEPEDETDLDEDNALLWYAERGHIEVLDGNWLTGLDLLTEAGRWMQQRRMQSLGAEIGRWFTNDTIAPYYGRGFETLQIGYWRWLTYLQLAQVADESRPPLSYLVTSDGRTTRPAPPSTDLPQPAWWYRERAINMALVMTQTDLGEVNDFPDGRYNNDAAIRMLSAMTPWTMPAPEASDLQFAQAEFGAAWRAYHELGSRFDDGAYQLEVDRPPEMLTRMLIRHGLRYDPEGLPLRLRSMGLGEDVIGTVGELPPDHGMILVLDHVGLITVPQPLVIRVVVGSGDPELHLDGSDRDRGFTISSRNFGAVAIWAKGPGSEVIDTWAVLPLPGDFAERVAPGGVAVMGVTLPAHATDSGIPTPASIDIAPAESVAAEATTWRPLGGLEVFWDLDAYARAALVDYQPEVLARTLIRATGKQAAVASAAHQAREDGNDALAFLINLFGSAIVTLTEDADIRAWSTLPDHVAGGLFDVPAGRHHLRLRTATGTIDLGPVTVHPGRVSVIPVHRPLGNSAVSTGQRKVIP